MAKQTTATIALDSDRQSMIDFIAKDSKFASIQMLVKSAGFKLESLEDSQLRQMIVNEKGFAARKLAAELIAYDFSVDVQPRKSMAGLVAAELDSQNIETAEKQEYQKLTLTLSTFAADGVDFLNLANHVIQLWVDHCDIICKTDVGEKSPTTKTLSKNLGKHWELVADETSE